MRKADYQRALLVALRHAKAPENAPAKRPGQDRFGASGWFVPIEAVEGLNQSIMHLSSEIDLMEPKPFELGDDVSSLFHLGQFKIEWAQFRVKWVGWMATKCKPVFPTSETICGFGESDVSEFRSFEQGYNEFRRRAVEEFGLKTSTKKSEEQVKTGALEETASAVKWVAIAVLAYLGFQALKGARSS